MLDPKTRRTQAAGAWGQSSLDYAVAEFRYRVSANAFFQINRHLVPGLLQEVIAQRQGSIAWDLYAGVGLFAQALVPRFKQVIAVESSPASAADLASQFACCTALWRGSQLRLRGYAALPEVPAMPRSPIL